MYFVYKGAEKEVQIETKPANPERLEEELLAEKTRNKEENEPVNSMQNAKDLEIDRLKEEIKGIKINTICSS